MELENAQAVLDKAAEVYSGISPQILRSAVGYGKSLIGTPSIERDGEESAMEALWARIRGYVDGYSRIFDGLYDTDVVNIYPDSRVAYFVDSLRDDYGEDVPTYVLSATSDFLSQMIIIQPEEETDGVLSDSMIQSGFGFIEGARECIDDLVTGKKIKDMCANFPPAAAVAALDIFVNETDYTFDNIEQKRGIYEEAGTSLVDFMDTAVLPRSGNPIVPLMNVDPLTLNLTYLLGFFYGRLGFGGDAEKEELEHAQQIKLRIAEGAVSIWTRGNGYGEDILKKAWEKAGDVAMKQAQGEKESVREGNPVFYPWNHCAAYGIGYADGYWMHALDSDVVETEEEAISRELDEVFAEFHFSEE